MNTNRTSHAVHGFTLVELMITLVMSLFLMGGAILMYLSVQSTYDDVNRMSRMQENIRFASDYMVRDIRNAGFKDEISLTIGQQRTIMERFVEISESGSELRVRYAGRGHCQEDFDSYRVVQNRYWLDTASGELRCTGSSDEDDFDDSGAGEALVGGLTGLSFQLHMADDDTTTSADTVCSDPRHPDFTDLELEDRCLAVSIGVEFEALRELDDATTSETRFVELFATFRNEGIAHIFGNLYDNDDDEDDD